MSTDILPFRKSYYHYYFDYCKAVKNSCNIHIDHIFDSLLTQNPNIQITKYSDNKYYVRNLTNEPFYEIFIIDDTKNNYNVITYESIIRNDDSIVTNFVSSNNYDSESLIAELKKLFAN